MDKKEAYRILKGIDSENRTAITMVMELAQQLRTEACFEEGTELIWNTNSFKFNARLGDITAVGEGRSKKEAKQNSAKELLNVIRNYETCNITSPQVPPHSTPVREPSPESPNPSSSCSTSESQFSVENAIGELQIMAAKNKWKLPEYEFPDAYGESHCKTFTCLVKMMSDLQCEGSGTTKKAAKKQAAEKMLNILQGDEVDSPDLKESTPLSPCYNQGSSSDSSVLDSSDLDDDNSSPYSDSLSHNLDVEGYFNTENSMEKLEEKRKMEGFAVEFIKLPNKSKTGLDQVFIKLTFDDNSKKPPVVTFGSGETAKIAESIGASRALEHLEIMKSLPLD